jgi:uncharacterized membrane protein
MKQINTSIRGQVGLILALAASSAMSVALYSARVMYTGQPNYLFLVWNLFLAWIPLWCAMGAWQLYRLRLSLGIPILLGVWLLFFPNAPYILTDLIHLSRRQQAPIWFDTIMLLSFAWSGLMVGFASLWIVQNLVEFWLGRIAGWTAAGLALAAAGFGMVLGRFHRWNSWDLFAQPQPLFQDIVSPLLNPSDHTRTLAATLLFFGFLSLAYLTTILLVGSRWDRTTS